MGVDRLSYLGCTIVMGNSEIVVRNNKTREVGNVDFIVLYPSLQLREVCVSFAQCLDLTKSKHNCLES